MKRLKKGDVVALVVRVDDPASFSVVARGSSEHRLVVNPGGALTTTATAKEGGGEKALPAELWVMVGSFLTPPEASRALFMVCKALWRLWAEYLRFTYDIQYDGNMRQCIREAWAEWWVTVAQMGNCVDDRGSGNPEGWRLTLYEFTMCKCDMGKLVVQYCNSPTVPMAIHHRMADASAGKPRALAASIGAVRRNYSQWAEYLGLVASMPASDILVFERFGGAIKHGSDWLRCYPFIHGHSHPCKSERIINYSRALSNSIFIDDIKAGCLKFNVDEQTTWFPVIHRIVGAPRMQATPAVMAELMTCNDVDIILRLHQLHAITVSSFNPDIIATMSRFVNHPHLRDLRLMGVLVDIIGDLVEPADPTADAVMVDMLDTLRRRFLLVQWGPESVDPNGDITLQWGGRVLPAKPEDDDDDDSDDDDDDDDD
jgi:hypothetical protein